MPRLERSEAASQTSGVVPERMPCTWQRRDMKYGALTVLPGRFRGPNGSASKTGVKLVFLVGNALNLEALGRRFDAVTDSGLFHAFSDDERPLFARSLSKAIRPLGTYFMLCFSEKEPAEWGGPRRVTQGEILETFDEGWEVNYIREARFETNIHAEGGRAWLSPITRL